MQNGKRTGKYVYTFWIYGSHGGDYEEYGLLGRSAVQFGNILTIRRNPAACFSWFLWSLIFDADDGVDKFLLYFGLYPN
jgi:hypothetical protein